MTHPYLKRAAIGIVAAALLGTVVYTKIYLPKITYETVQSRSGTLVRAVGGVGTLEAKEIVVLAPKTTAKIAALYADEGDRVDAGAVLARMELSDLAGNRSETLALIDKSRAQKGLQQALIDDYAAKVQLADATLGRYEALFKEGFVTRAELDGAQAASRSARAQLSAAKEALAQSQHEVQRLQGSLSALGARIDDLVLRTPVQGIVIERRAEEGSTVAAGSPVLRIANPSTVWVKCYIDERQSGALEIGQAARVELRSQPHRTWNAKVGRIGVESDRITEERVVYLSLDELPFPLHLGEQAEVTIDLSTLKGGMILPSDAVVTRGGQTGVWTAKEGKARFRPVTVLGESGRGEVAVQGIGGSDRVLLENQRPLSDGARVRI